MIQCPRCQSGVIHLDARITDQSTGQRWLGFLSPGPRGLLTMRPAVANAI